MEPARQENPISRPDLKNTPAQENELLKNYNGYSVDLRKGVASRRVKSSTGETFILRIHFPKNCSAQEIQDRLNLRDQSTDIKIADMGIAMKLGIQRKSKATINKLSLQIDAKNKSLSVTKHYENGKIRNIEDPIDYYKNKSIEDNNKKSETKKLKLRAVERLINSYFDKKTQRSPQASPLVEPLRVELSSLNAQSKERGDAIKSKKFNRALSKTIKLADFKKIAQGNAKRVFINANLPESAFYRPVNDLSEKIFKSRTKEIEEEIEIGKSIEGKISGEIKKKFNIEEGKLHLATHMELKEVDGERVYQTARADGDLEKMVNSGELKYPQSRDLAFKMLKGMAILHATGYVHGDLKLENVLYKKEDNGEIDVMIADFGKTTALGSDERKIHMGNNRYQDPNGGLSQRAEVYSVALIMIRALEGELIGKVEPGSDSDMLPLDQEILDNLDQKRAENNRHGVEKFLVAHRDCPQTEKISIRGKVRVIELEARAAAKIKSSYDLKKSEGAIHSYIDALREGLKASHPESKGEIDAISDLLKEMTRSKVDSGDNARTRTLEDAFIKFSNLLNLKK